MMKNARMVGVTATGTTGAARNAALWVAQVLSAAALGMAGFAKLAGAPDMVALFEAVGIGQWLRYVTGVLEVGGAILLLIPAVAGLGALLLAAVMAGAVFTEFLIVGGNPVPPLVLLMLVGGIAYGRREQSLATVGLLSRQPFSRVQPSR